MARSEPDLLDRLIDNFSFRGLLLHQTTLFLLATGTLIVGAIVLWERQQPEIAAQEEFRLTETKIEITPTPEWADSDIKKLILKKAGNQPSILDPTLVPNAASVIKNAGYVEQVQKIEKSKAGLAIDLVYRQPVAAVELSEVTLLDKWPPKNRGRKVLWPIDRKGVVMPEFDLGGQVPIITILYPVRLDQLKTWGEWPDERVVDAARIANLFRDQSEAIGVHRVVTFRKPDGPSDGMVPFELWSRSGAQVIWGNAPGKELKDEANHETKLEMLQKIIDQHGSIEAMDNIRIDLRSGEAVVAGEMKTASSQNWLANGTQELKR